MQNTHCRLNALNSCDKKSSLVPLFTDFLFIKYQNSFLGANLMIKNGFCAKYSQKAKGHHIDLI